MPQDTAARFPTHVAIIVDGNRRWAKQRLMPVSLGHKAGFDRLREITRYAVGDRGVFVLSLCCTSFPQRTSPAMPKRSAI